MKHLMSGAILSLGLTLMSITMSSGQLEGGGSRTLTTSDGTKYTIAFAFSRTAANGMIIASGKGKTIVCDREVITTDSGHEYRWPTTTLVDSLLPSTRSRLQISQLQLTGDSTATDSMGARHTVRVSVPALLLDSTIPNGELEFLFRDGYHFPMVFAPGSEITISDSVAFGDFLFVSDRSERLVLRLRVGDPPFERIGGAGYVTRRQAKWEFPPSGSR